VLIGDPVAYSSSPLFQNAALRAAGIDAIYEARRVAGADLPQVTRELAREGAAGNVTAPHKKRFLELCGEVSAIASRVGAVNTFWSQGGSLVGDNTDVGGFDSLARKVLGGIPAGLETAVVGAGGAAAGVLGAIEGWPGSRVRLFSRRREQAAELAGRFSDFVRVETSSSSALRGAMLVVNATPVGMTDDSMPFDLGELSEGATVMDLVYRPGGTALTRAAAAAGLPAADGTGMLVEQGALSFERWFGFPPDRNVMYAALR